MKTPIGALALVLFLSTTALAADVPPYPAFTADTEMKAGGNTQTGKVAFGKGKMRMEMALGENTMVTIFDYGASKMYSLLPPPMGCMEQAIEKDPKDPLYASMSTVEEESLGEETIDGHPTKKVRVTAEVEGESHSSLLWKAKDLKDLPIRIAAEDGSFEMNYKNVVLGEPDAKLLTPPADCKANPFGAMMDSMKKSMPAAPKAP
jgi:hypothetical protein